MNNPQPFPELVSPYTFAERKGVKNTSVYYRIQQGEIKTIPVGKFNLIDWEKYKHIEFPHAEKIKNKRAGVQPPKVKNDTVGGKPKRHRARRITPGD